MFLNKLASILLGFQGSTPSMDAFYRWLICLFDTGGDKAVAVALLIGTLTWGRCISPADWHSLLI